MTHLPVRHSSTRKRIRYWRTICLITGSAFLVLGAFLLEEHIRGGRALDIRLKEGQLHHEKLTFAQLELSRTNSFDLAPYVPKLSFPALSVSSGSEVQLPNGQSLTWVALREQMESARESMEHLRKSLKDEAFQKDSGPDTAPLIQNFVRLRTAAQWLAASALSRAHNEDTAGALDDLECLSRLAKPAHEHILLIQFMIREAITGLANSILERTLTEPGWTADQLRALRVAWAPWVTSRHLRATLEVERAFRMAAFERMRNDSYPLVDPALWEATRWKPGKRVVFFPILKFAWLDQDELSYLRRMDDAWRIASAFPDEGSLPGAAFPRAFVVAPSSGSIAVALAGWNVLLGRVFGRFRSTSEVSEFFNADFEKALQTSLRNEIGRDLAVAGIAVREFELRQGKLPSDLAALVPEVLAAKPVDRMDGKPLRYRINADQTCILYSVGLNGKDDGGTSRAQLDIAFSLSAWPNSASKIDGAKP